MIHWSPDPTLIALPFGPGDGIQIRYYGLMFAIGFLTGYQLIYKFCKGEGRDFIKLEPLLYYLVIGMTVGARLGHVLFYEPSYYFSHPTEILKIWEGGLASHGGALGIIIGIWLFSRRHKEFDMLWIMDRLCVPTALTFGLIRLGNLMNSEILGKPADVPWAFVFERIDAVPRHPVQLYESLGYLLTFVITLIMYYRFKGRVPRARLVSVMIILVVSVRFFAEFFKMPQSEMEPALLTMGQMLNIPFLLAGLGMLYYSYTPKAEPPPATAAAGHTKPSRGPKTKKKKR